MLLSRVAAAQPAPDGHKRGHVRAPRWVDARPHNSRPRQRDDNKTRAFFGNDSMDVYGKAVERPSTVHGVTERCRAIARKRVLLGCRQIQHCISCGENSFNEAIVQCDSCQCWYRPRCDAVETFELWHHGAVLPVYAAARLPPCRMERTCRLYKFPKHRGVPTLLLLCRSGTAWKFVSGREKTTKSLSSSPCRPFSATATEGPLVY